MARKRFGKATPARVLALELTRSVRLRDAYVRELVDTRRQDSSFSAEEFAFAQVLAFGVVMCSGTLDELIDRNLASPHDIKPKVRDALRISSYELLFLHKPDHVVVNQGVELVRHVTPRAAGLANAVLRKMIADARQFPWGDPADDDAAFARAVGMPRWICERLIAQYGRENAADILQASLKPAPTYLRDNPFAPDAPYACDLSAQHVASLVPLQGTILEIGAGRGTKTMLLESRALETLGHTVPIHAIDVHEYRTRLLEQRMAQNGIDCVRAYSGDARDLDGIAGLPAAFDAALVDAPCSGTGTLRRHPEIRWQLAPRDIDEMAALQLALLGAAANRVTPGGVLVYATCSVFEQENKQVVDAFLASATGGAWHREADDFQSLPQVAGPDGHYACVLRRALQ